MKYVELTLARPDTGAVLPLARVTVFQSDGVTAASIYNSTGGSIANPIIADTNGKIGFAATDADYMLSAVSADGSLTLPKIRVQVYDLAALVGNAAAAGAAQVVLATASAAAAATSSAIVGVLGAPAVALPFAVTAISGGAGTGTGGTNGTYALGVTGGPPGFAGTVTIAGGTISAYTITNSGLATTSAVPTLSLAGVTGLTGATAPTATVATVPVGRTFWAPSSDGSQLLAWANAAGALAAYGSPQFSQYLAPGSLALLSSLAPVTIGDGSGAVSSGSSFYSFGAATPVISAGLLTQVQFGMSASATVSLLIWDSASLTVLKVFAGIAAVTGTNTLTQYNGLGAYYCPARAMVQIVVTSGAGLQLMNTASAYAGAQFTTSAVSGLVAGNTLPTPVYLAANVPALTVTTTPTLAQNVDTRLAVIENNHPAESSAFVGREAYNTLRAVGVTTLNTAATVASSAGRIHCTPPLTHGAKTVSAYLNMMTAGSGLLCFFKQADGVPNYNLWRVIPTGPLVAGGNTVALPELDMPLGTVMGFYAQSGGVLATIGNNGRPSTYISATGFTGIPGTANYTMVTATAAGELGMFVLGASTRLAVSPTAKQMRDADNGRIKPRLPTFFLKGVWDQPASTMAAWAARGANFMFGNYADFANSDAAGWLAGIAANSLYYVRRPGLYSLEQSNSLGSIASAAQLTQVANDVAADSVSQYAIGFTVLDEPDGSMPREQGNASPNALTPLYHEREIARWKQVNRAKPVFMNLQGFHVNYPSASIAAYLNMRDVDIFGIDTYPNNNGLGSANCLWWQMTYDAAQTVYDSFSTVNGAALEDISQTNNANFAQFGPTISGGKPTFAHIATSRVTSSPGIVPLPGEFRCLSWSSVIGGVIGLFYFPQDVTSGAYVADASDTNVLTEMGYLHSNLAVMQTAGCLIDAANGGRVAFIKRMSAPITKVLGIAYPGTFPKDSVGTTAVFQSPVGRQMQGGFEGISIVGNNGALYYLILNLLGVTATLNDTLWGISGMAFTAYEARFVAASALTTNLFTESGL